MIKENFVGTNTSGTTAIQNGGGIWVRQAMNNRVESNLVSGNSLGILVGTNAGFGETAAYVDGYAQHPERNGAGGTYTTGNQIFGNVIGLNAARNAAIPGSSIGMIIGENARNNLIGSASGAYNLVSGNTATVGFGILLGTLTENPNEDALPQFNTFQGNVIGLAGNLQTTISNTKGFVLLGAARNTIGGDTDLLANTIVASTQEGVSILDRTRENTFLRNFIGVLPPGFGARPGQLRAESPDIGAYGNGSHGILLSNGAQQNTLGGANPNFGLVISGNGGSGIFLASTAGSGNRFGANSISGNTGVGIDLGENGFTPNDPADADTGPNNLQNYPTITSVAVNAGGDLIVSFQVDSAPANSAYGTSGLYVEFFNADPSGEGSGSLGSDRYLISDYGGGALAVRQKNLGNAAALGYAGAITATATDADGNSSEFAPAVAGSASISGQVLTPAGGGLRNAVVSVTDSLGVRRTATTSSFGFYSVENLPTGQPYTIKVSSRRYRFINRVVTLSSSLSNINFVGLE